MVVLDEAALVVSDMSALSARMRAAARYGSGAAVLVRTDLTAPACRAAAETAASLGLPCIQAWCEPAHPSSASRA